MSLLLQLSGVEIGTVIESLNAAHFTPDQLDALSTPTGQAFLGCLSKGIDPDPDTKEDFNRLMKIAAKISDYRRYMQLMFEAKVADNVKGEQREKDMVDRLVAEVNDLTLTKDEWMFIHSRTTPFHPNVLHTLASERLQQSGESKVLSHAGH